MFATTAITTISRCHATYLTRFAHEGLFSSHAAPEAFVRAVQPRLCSANLLHYFPCLSPLYYLLSTLCYLFVGHFLFPFPMNVLYIGGRMIVLCNEASALASVRQIAPERLNGSQ